MDGERVNAQPIQLAAAGEKSAGYRQAHVPDVLIVVLHHSWQLHNPRSAKLSHYLTALAMKQTGLKPAAKIVLYWLADHHNQSTGECFPSINRLIELCEMTRRAVQNTIDDLEAAGLVEVVTRHRPNGSQTSNIYVLKLAQDGVQNMHTPRAENAPPPMQNMHPLNLVNNNLVNEQEEIIGARAPVINEASEIFDCLTMWASEAAVKSFIEYRKKFKSKGLTLTAAKRLASTLREISNAGGDTDDALGLAEERGWPTVKADWYFQSQRTTQRGKGGAGSGMAAAFASVAAKVLEMKQRGAEHKPEPRERLTADRAAEIMRDVGFGVKRMEWK